MHDHSTFSSGPDGGFFGGSPSASPPDGGYFAAPLPATPAWSGEGYGTPLAAGGAVPVGPTSAAAGPAGVPPFVAAAVAFLLLAAVAAVYTGLSGLVLVQATHTSVGGGAPGDGVVARSLLLLVNGAANLYVAWLLVQGQHLGRILASLVCGGWVCYWLYETSRVSSAFGKVSHSAFGDLVGLGQIGTVATLGLLLLAGWAAVTALLLWMSSASRHFG